ncbi:MAG: zf-HC2 domain-containing protein [Kordiimonadaceae bacterium]|nr:zf-HC2 domain-containing protein [Kordiimonadaceae bacterium]MBO6568640.1 zf-HC2 domain-containing protein [Kordiimonadaceae bacterium]MBO6965384.1 zf-HC2 domain-containing protein [Kordiimonadaceae bacterium]
MTIYDRYINMIVRARGETRPTSWLRQRIGGAFLRFGPGMISCRKFDKFLADYVDGNLSKRQLRVFEAHMKICPYCRSHFQTYVATYKLVGGVFGQSDEELPMSVPAELEEAVFDALDADPKKGADPPID